MLALPGTQEDAAAVHGTSGTLSTTPVAIRRAPGAAAAAIVERNLKLPAASVCGSNGGAVEFDSIGLELIAAYAEKFVRGYTLTAEEAVQAVRGAIAGVAGIQNQHASPATA